MRTLTAVCLIVFCLSPLWADSTKDEIDNLPLEVGAVYENGMIRTSGDNRIFQVELEYSLKTRFTDRVFWSWPGFSKEKDYPYAWRMAGEVVPEMYASGISRDLGHPPTRTDEYRAGVQYLNPGRTIDVRILLAMAHSVGGKHITPRIEIRHLHLWQLFDNTEIFARGLSNLKQTTYGIGLSQDCGSLNAKVIYDNSGQINWSLGFSTRLGSSTSF